MDSCFPRRPSVLRFLFLPVLLASSLGAVPAPHSQTIQEPAVSAQQEPSRLAVVWTSGDREVALKVAFMYTLNAKSQGWFDEVTLIVWGPSSNLLAHDQELQEYVQRMAEEGVTVVACQACADSYGVSEDLRALGIDVKYMGVPLTEMLQGDWEVITF
jgi:hypothetical protein